MNLVCGVVVPGLDQNLATLYFFALGAAQQDTCVVAGTAFVEQLAEHFDTGADGLNGRSEANDFDFFADFDDTAFDTAGNNSTAAFDREHVFDRHQERLVDRALRLRDERVNRFHQLEDRIVAEGGILAFQRANSQAFDDRGGVTREFVFVQELAYFHFNEFDQFGISQVHLVEEHDQSRERQPGGPAGYVRGFAGPGRSQQQPPE